MDFKLTNSGRLLLARRREGITQEQAARRYGVSIKRYRAWEHGKEKGPLMILHDVRPYEICFLLRLAAELSQKELAEELGCSRTWLNRMELGLVSYNRLVEYWDGQ